MYDLMYNVIDALKNGTITAFIADSSVFAEHEAEDQDSRLVLVLDTWRQVNTGFFHARHTATHTRFFVIIMGEY